MQRDEKNLEALNILLETNLTGISGRKMKKFESTSLSVYK